MALINWNALSKHATNIPCIADIHLIILMSAQHTAKHNFLLHLNFAIGYVQNLVHFNLADFPVDFVKQFVSLWR